MSDNIWQYLTTYKKTFSLFIALYHPRLNLRNIIEIGYQLGLDYVESGPLFVPVSQRKTCDSWLGREREKGSTNNCHG